MTIYQGSNLAISQSLPSSLTLASFKNISFITGECSLREVPKLDRGWQKTTNSLAGRHTNFPVKTIAEMLPVNFILTSRATDEAQVIYRGLEMSLGESGSFRLTIPNGGVFYFIAQVSNFSYVEGGGGDRVHSSSIELLLQCAPVHDVSNIGLEPEITAPPEPEPEPVSEINDVISLNPAGNEGDSFTVDVSVNDSYIDGAVTYEILDTYSGLSNTPIINSSGIATYEPVNGSFSFQYGVFIDGISQGTATVSGTAEIISTELVDDAVSPNPAGFEGDTFTHDVSANDTYIEGSVTYGIVGASVNLVNAPTISSAGIATYEPSDGAFSFEYQVFIDGVSQGTATVSGTAEIEPPGVATLSTLAGTAGFTRIDSSDGQNIDIEWPDGTAGVVSSGASITSSQPAGNVVIKPRSGSDITRIESDSPFDFDLAALSRLNALTRLRLRGEVSVHGDIANLPAALKYCNIQGQTTVSGDVDNLPSVLEFFLASGSNTTYGNVGNLPSSMTYYDNSGSNTTHGSVANLPSFMTHYINRGDNTTSGDVADLSNSIIYYQNQGLNTVVATSLKPYAVFQFFMQRGNGFDQAGVDAVLAGFDQVTTWTGAKSVNLLGNNAAPSSAGQASASSIASKGVTVLTN